MGISFGLDGPGSFLGFFFFALLAVLAVASWIILATSRLIQGGVVERPERVPQLYGYAVCLVAILVALASVVTIVNSTFDLAAPALNLNDEFGVLPSVSSFEAYRATYERERRMMAPPGQAQPDTLPEAVLRQRFEALRADRIERTRLKAIRSIVSSGIALLLSIVLFILHWRWMRRLHTSVVA